MSSEITEERVVLEEILTEEGYSVSAVKNGQEALELLHQHSPPSLIFLDLSMPVMDGLQFREKQLQEAEIAHIPTYVLTAGFLLRKARAIPFTGIATKPFKLKDVLNVAKRHIPFALK